MVLQKSTTNNIALKARPKPNEQDQNQPKNARPKPNTQDKTKNHEFSISL